MPLMDFLTGGDPKFMIVNSLLFIAVLVQVIRRKKTEDNLLIDKLSKQLGQLSFTIVMLSLLSLLLGLLHSFYFIGQANGIATGLLYSGMSYTLISPTYGLILFLISKLLIGSIAPKLEIQKI